MATETAVEPTTTKPETPTPEPEDEGVGVDTVLKDLTIPGMFEPRLAADKQAVADPPPGDRRIKFTPEPEPEPPVQPDTRPALPESVKRSLAHYIAVVKVMGHAAKALERAESSYDNAFVATYIEKRGQSVVSGLDAARKEKRDAYVFYTLSTYNAIAAKRSCVKAYKSAGVAPPKGLD